MAEPTLEALVSPIGSLKAALLVTVEDALLYRAWQRDGERWSAELGAARYGDMLRATRAGLGQLGESGSAELDQLTIESSDALALLSPLSDAVYAILLFDVGTPLGLARHHFARMLADLRSLASAVGPVGAAASRRASALVADELLPAAQPAPTPPLPPLPKPPPKPSAPPAPAPSAPAPSASAGSVPGGSPSAGAPSAGSAAGRASPTLVTPHETDDDWPAIEPPKARAVTTLVTGTMPAFETPPLVSADRRAVPPEPPPMVAVPLSLEDEDTSPQLSVAEPPTKPRETSPLPGPQRVPETLSPGERARELLHHLTEHAPDAHIALKRVALQTGLPLDLLRAPARITPHDLALLEAAVRRILGLERLHL
jgi:hypothetical protein